MSCRYASRSLVLSIFMTVSSPGRAQTKTPRTTPSDVATPQEDTSAPETVERKARADEEGDEAEGTTRTELAPPDVEAPDLVPAPKPREQIPELPASDPPAPIVTEAPLAQPSWEEDDDDAATSPYESLRAASPSTPSTPS